MFSWCWWITETNMVWTNRFMMNITIISWFTLTKSYLHTQRSTWMDIISKNRFTWRNITSTDSFTWTNVASTNNITGTGMSTTNRFTWTNITNTNMLTCWLIGLLARTKLALTAFCYFFFIFFLRKITITNEFTWTNGTSNNNFNNEFTKETELRAGTILDNVGKSFKFKLKSVEHIAFL